MEKTDSILHPPSDEPEDRTAYAVQAIREAVEIIGDHYTDATEWPGWADDAGLAVRVASRLLVMAAPEATLRAR